MLRLNGHWLSYVPCSGEYARLWWWWLCVMCLWKAIPLLVSGVGDKCKNWTKWYVLKIYTTLSTLAPGRLPASTKTTRLSQMVKHRKLAAANRQVIPHLTKNARLYQIPQNHHRLVTKKVNPPTDWLISTRSFFFFVLRLFWFSALACGETCLPENGPASVVVAGGPHRLDNYGCFTRSSVRAYPTTNCTGLASSNVLGDCSSSFYCFERHYRRFCTLYLHFHLHVSSRGRDGEESNDGDPQTTPPQEYERELPLSRF